MKKQVLCDVVKAYLIGTAAGMASALVLFAAGFMAGGWKLQKGLETARDGLMLAGAAGFFLLAGMLLIKGQKPEKFMPDNGWRRHFGAIGIKSVIGIICMAVLMVGISMDYLIRES